jgi:hypothetical protein
MLAATTIGLVEIFVAGRAIQMPMHSNIAAKPIACQIRALPCDDLRPAEKAAAMGSARDGNALSDFNAEINSFSSEFKSSSFSITTCHAPLTGPLNVKLNPQLFHRLREPPMCRADAHFRDLRDLRIPQFPPNPQHDNLPQFPRQFLQR